jgi:YHS domain-containing protein
MKISAIATLAMLLLGTVALFAAEDQKPATDQKSKPAATQPTTRPAKPFNKKCPVMDDEDVDPKITYTYKGKVYGFCCKDCIADFKKDPEAYAKKAK